MSLFMCFENFDPKEGEFTFFHHDAFSDICLRAREILSNKSSVDIHNGMEVVQHMINTGEESAYFAALKDNLQYDKPVPYTKALKEFKQKYTIDDYLNFPRNEWHENFAILALAIIGEAVNIYEYSPYKDEMPTEFEKLYLESELHLLIQAMEAVITAESLHEIYLQDLETTDEIENERKEKISISMRELAYKSHQSEYQIYKELLEFFMAGDYSTYADAVADFVKVIPADRLKSFAPTNIHRTLRDTLSGLVRGTRTIPELPE